MKKINTLLFIGFITVLLVGVAFYYYVGMASEISKNGVDWGIFGDYFGGVAGTLLSFISILLLVFTIRIQNDQFLHSYQEALKRDVLAHVEKVDDEIQYWLARKLAYQSINGQTIEFGDVVWGIVGFTSVNKNELEVAIKRLLQLTILYCEALALYRENINGYFIFKYHQQKAQSLVSFLKANQSYLSPNSDISLKFCQMHLDGKDRAK